MNPAFILPPETTVGWLYLPAAVLLGALHGLEPGHSKTMMAAFIVAVRGTVAQALLLGLAAAVSHTLIIWGLVGLALHYGSQWNVETTEPYLQLGTGAVVIGLALWTLWRIRRDRAGHNHHHHDHAENRSLTSPWGGIDLSIEEASGPARWRVNVPAGAQAGAVVVTLRRAEGPAEVFKLEPAGGDWVSPEAIPEPHEFTAEVSVYGPRGGFSGEMEFHECTHEHDSGDDEELDAHAAAHAADIRRRFDGSRPVTTGQIILFGLTGGLMPCPAAFSVLLLCLQLKKLSLGFALVAAFSLGLAVTLVTVGVVAAWGASRLVKSSGRFSGLARNAPYLSSSLLILLGVVLMARGAYHLI
jgi:nickel/cobalt exporter